MPRKTEQEAKQQAQNPESSDFGADVVHGVQAPDRPSNRRRGYFQESSGCCEPMRGPKSVRIISLSEAQPHPDICSLSRGWVEQLRAASR
jgi:hypothetical protein